MDFVPIFYCDGMATMNEDFNRGCERIQTPVFFNYDDQTLCNDGFFTRYSVNVSENGDFNGGCNGFLTECFKNVL